MSYNSPALIFDRQIFNQLIETMGDEGRDLVRNLIDVYITEARLLLERIEAAIKRGDAPQLAHDAHKLKGSSLSMGANLLAGCCARLEEYGLSGHLDSHTQALRGQAAEELGRFCVALELYREEQGL